MLLSQFYVPQLPKGKLVLQLLFIEDKRQRYFVLLGFGLEDITEYYCLDTRPFLRILIKHLLKQHNEILRYEIGMLAHLVVEDFVFEFLHLSSWERVVQAA